MQHNSSGHSIHHNSNLMNNDMMLSSQSSSSHQTHQTHMSTTSYHNFSSRNSSQSSFSNAQTELEGKIDSLSSAHRDDLKLKILQEIWGKLEQVYNLSAYDKVIEKLMRSFLNLFCSTSPQFIAENNTQQLRRLILEIILRMSSVESIKPHSKELMKQMMRLISVENEENAILAIKIIIDQGRSNGRMTYTQEVSNAMATFRKMLVDLTTFAHINPEMFATRDMGRQYSNCSDEQLISENLKNCFHSQPLSLNNSGNDSKYNLIPMASQSVKVLQEVPMLIVFFYQHHKHSVQTETMEFIRLSFDFLNVQIPKDMSNINQSLADNFCTAQSKFLSFINIMGKVPAFLDLVLQNAPLVVNGVLQLLEQCPADLIPVRREVLMALKLFSTSEMKSKLFPVLPRLISETALLGTGFTSIDNLKAFMYQMLADLLHHMRTNLPFDMLSHVSFVFCRQLHDSSTNTQVQIMSARLLNSVTECMGKMETQGEPTRDLLIEILEALVAKLKVLAVYHLPALFKQYSNDGDNEKKITAERAVDDQTAALKEPTGIKLTKRKKRRLSIDSVDEIETAEKVPPILPPPTKDGKFSSPEAIMSSLSVIIAPPVSLSDGKNLVKYIMQTCKFTTSQLKETRPSVDTYECAKERDLFERLLKYGVMCMDMFAISSKPQSHPAGVTRSKEEKETLESLAHVFATIDHGVFRELFEKYMDFLIERIFNSRNYPLQLMVNTFLVRNEVPSFASIMLTFLMSRMSCLAVSNEKTALYVKLFKIIFSAIGTHQPNVEGERMLKPFLPDLIRQATYLALSAREPLNYFLLLRALFRSIGGGAHDILYSKFLPLLPNLLQFLNKLQSCQHRIQMRELFVELCLTVPVRLSSLLPYLPLLMDPLVCALNGSQSLVQQGLRTLELCVDNLQPEYLFEHMLPVRGALMQGLWKVVGTSKDESSVAGAFRILGKFGGANRKMLNEPQFLQVADTSEVCQSYINMEFSRMGLDGNLSIHLPLSEIMKVAVEQMKLSSLPAEPLHQIGNVPLPQMPSFHLRQQCMELARSVLLTGLGPAVVLNVDTIKKMGAHIRKVFLDFRIEDAPEMVYKCGRENDRQLFVNALLVLFYGVISKDVLRQQYLKFFNAVLRQLSLIGVLEFIGGNKWLRNAEEEGMQNLCMDSSVLVDALVAAFSDSNKDFCFSAMVALRHINDTCSAALVSTDLMSRVPFCKYLLEKIMRLCHGPAWFARLGGASALSYMIDKFPKSFIEDNLVVIIDSLIEVIMGTVDEIASGSTDMAMESLERLQKCVLLENENKNEVEQRTRWFVSAYAKYLFHGNEDVRKKIAFLLKQCASVSTLESTYDGFIYRFREYFMPDVMRTLNTAPYMSLADATASLSSFYELLNIKPMIYNFDSDRETWHRFINYLLDISQTDTHAILQRNAFKKCETCASHFLPPIPIPEQIEILKSNALKCLVIIYDNMRNQNGEPMETNETDLRLEEISKEMLEKMAIWKKRIELPDIFEQTTTHVDRLILIALKADLDLEATEINEKAHDALKKIAPLPIDVLNTVGFEVLSRVQNKFDDETSEKEQSEMNVDDVLITAKLFELNNKVLTKKMAEKMVNRLSKWKINEKVAKLTMTTGVSSEGSKLSTPAPPVVQPAGTPSSMTPTSATTPSVPTPPTSANSPEIEKNREESLEELKLKSCREVDAIAAIFNMMAKCNDVERVNAEMVIKMASFAAHFEYSYSQDILHNWIKDLAEMLSRFPNETIQFVFSADSLAKQSVRSLFKRIIDYPESEGLRQEMIKNTDWFEKVFEGKQLENNEWKEIEYSEKIMSDREMFVLSIIDLISRSHCKWLTSPTSPIPRLKELWNNSEFKKRYVVRSPTEDDLKNIVVQHMTEHKYKVPKLIINCFLRYLRLSHLDLELYFDVITVFIGNYVTDFCYVREFLETEVIPVMPLLWRRDAFLKIMEMFETNPDKTVTDLRVVKAIQYLVIPCLQWAFERYDVDEIVGVGEASPEAVDEDPNNLVSRLAKVIEAHRQKMSDGMVIVFYQMCTLFVQHAPHHIHNNNCKKQGGRLRVFMLFAWPCLTLANHQDPTMRFTGFYFLANIIERFTINRRIVLQVFQCLTTTYQQDNRDQVRKAIDILTPAVPIRMDDGHAEILKSVRKVLTEELHNLQHVQHVVSMIVRNYRVYFHVRHELLTPLMNAVQRSLVMPNSVTDSWITRRMAIDCCEMVIKWELLRNQRLEAQAQISAEEAQEVDKMLEKMKSTGQDAQREAEEAAANLCKKEKFDDVLQRPIAKENVDQIVNMLVKFCVMFQFQFSSTQLSSGVTEVIKRSQGLLRAALKPYVWGEIATIRHSIIEKCLLIQPDMRQESSNQSLTNAQNALDLLVTLVNVMPKQLLLNTLRPLQRAIISCLNSGIGILVRLVNTLVGRLFEKTRCSVNGLDELEIFNQYITKYLNDQFASAIKNPNSQVAQIYTAFSLLRTICTHQPGYVDAVCLTAFIRITEKAAKEHLGYVQAGQDPGKEGREKGVSELVCLALELIRPRVEYFTVDMRKMVAVNILADLIVKTNYDKVVDSCLKIIREMLATSDLEFAMQTALPLLGRVQFVIERKFRDKTDLVNNFLHMVLRVYENIEYRNSEYGHRLWEGFYWGLSNSDAEIRERFLVAWESTWPHLATIDMFQRMKYILQNQDWSKFRQYFWLKHALWSMLRSVSIKGKEEASGRQMVRRKRILMLNCASPWKTFEIAANLKKMEEPMEVDVKEELIDDDDLSDYEKKLKTLFDEQQPLLEEASQFDFAQSIDAVAQIAFGVNDTKFVGSMWIMLFKSFWSSVPQPNELKDMVVPFLSSGAHNSYISGVEKSVLAVWLDAMSNVVQLPPRLIEFISLKHECWHTGIKLLEKSAMAIPKQLIEPQMVDEKDLETLDSLAALYSSISEFDQYAAIWDRRGVNGETSKMIANVQLGEMETAVGLIEQVMSSSLEQMNNKNNGTNENGTEEKEQQHISPLLDREYDLWMNIYIDCMSELIQWQTVAEICNGKEMQWSRGLMAAAIHIPDWGVVEECRNQISGCIPPDFYADYTIYNTMLTIRKNGNSNGDSSISMHREQIKKAVDECIDVHIARWRALPPVVTYAHSKILQSMNLIREVEESMDLRCVLEEAGSKFDGSLLQDMKNLIKIWRSRGTTTSDDLKFVSTLYDWRMQIHSLVLKRFEQWEKLGVRSTAVNVPPGASNHSILPIHSSAQGQLSIAKTANKLGYYNVSKDVMNRIAGMQSIPLLDSHQKVCDYVKVLKNQAMSTTDDELKKEFLLEALEVVEDTRIDDLTKDQISKLFSLRAHVHSLLNQPEYAESAFTAAAQLVEFKNVAISSNLVHLMKLWGQHTYKMMFSNTVNDESASKYGRQSLTCFLTAARVDVEHKARKYIAKALWLAKHLSICGPQSSEALNRIIKQQLYTLNVFNWLYWLPQLITEIKHRPNSMFLMILIKLIPTYTMQVFYHLRDVMPLTVIDKVLEQDNFDDPNNGLADDVAFSDKDPLTRMLRLAIRYRPTDVRVFHRLLRELDQMAEFWVEKHIRYAVNLKDQIFSDLSKQMDANFNEVSISPDALKLMNEWKMRLTDDLRFYELNYGLECDKIKMLRGFEVRKGFLGINVARILFEKEVGRASDDQPSKQDEWTFVREMSSTMIQNLSMSIEAIQPLKFVEIVIAWIKSMKARIATLPKRIPLESVSPYLSRFSHRIGCVEMPFDLLNVIRVRNHNSPTANQSGQYVSMISRFEPTIEIVIRGGQTIRRLNIRGQTGKTCSFYLRKFIRPERTNRVPQLFSHLNFLLTKDRETARRHLHVPMMTQLKTSKYSVIQEVASIQPYTQPAESGMINPASQVEIIHPIDILAQSFAEMRMSPDDIVYMFFDRFAQSAKSIAPTKMVSMVGGLAGTSNATPPEGSAGTMMQQAIQQQTQPYHIQHIIYEDFVRDVVPNGILYDYLMMRYPDNTMYFMLRKQIVHCLSVLSVIESHCNLTPFSLDHMMLAANTGVLCNSRYQFEVAPKDTKLNVIDRQFHEVPFRLTPNFALLVGIAQEGDLQWSMAATAKCLWKRSPDVVMRPLLWDEHADNLDSANPIYVCHATNTYVNGVMKKLENTNSTEARLRRDDIVSQINRAKDTDNLARMPPTYHPWF